MTQRATLYVTKNGEMIEKMLSRKAAKTVNTKIVISHQPSSKTARKVSLS